MSDKSEILFSEIEGYFANEGVIAANLPGYEHRTEQSRMAFAVADAFNADRVAMIEAGTGTGKSLAYLLPAAIWARRNRERIVVSTNTINLQEQLTGKDIPFLQKHTGLTFKSLLVKGRSNYLCLRKLATHHEEPNLFADEKNEINAILEWSRSGGSGSRDGLGFIPKDEVWEELCCEADQCSRNRCKYFSRCHFFNARKTASSADILVVNHALLLADLACRESTASNAILPPFQRVIIDEAHHLEDVATGSLSLQITRNTLLKTLAKLQHPRRPDRGLLPKLSVSLAAGGGEPFRELLTDIATSLEELMLHLPPIADRIGKEMDAIAYAVSAEMRGKGSENGEQKLRLTPAIYASEFWGETVERINSLATALAAYCLSLSKLEKKFVQLPEALAESVAGLIVDTRGVTSRLEQLLEGLCGFSMHDDAQCRWFEMRRGGKSVQLRICSSPLDVASQLKRVLFDRFKSVIMTSATLAVGGKFDYFSQRTGVSLLPEKRRTELLLASPFDHASQVFAAVPTDICEPTDKNFEQQASNCIARALAISRGRAFVLFTSYDLLKKIHSRLAPQLEAAGLETMRQGEAGRHQLLDRFRKSSGGVLFGTDSFWEGVDVQGDALGLVIITRLPFRVPTEPILEARSEHISATGGDPFMEYTVPQAVIKFRQGFGRLIRSRSDRGGVLILDKRVLTKGYGRIFLKSLPEVQVSATTGQEMFDGLQRFFQPE